MPGQLVQFRYATDPCFKEVYYVYLHNFHDRANFVYYVCINDRRLTSYFKLMMIYYGTNSVASYHDYSTS